MRFEREAARPSFFSPNFNVACFPTENRGKPVGLDGVNGII